MFNYGNIVIRFDENNSFFIAEYYDVLEDYYDDLKPLYIAVEDTEIDVYKNMVKLLEYIEKTINKE